MHTVSSQQFIDFHSSRNKVGAWGDRFSTEGEKIKIRFLKQDKFKQWFIITKRNDR